MTTTSYRRRLAYDRANGIPRRVDATQTRHHIERLIARGWTQTQIAAAAHLNQATVSIVVSGQYACVQSATATAILNIRLDQAPPIPRGLVDATGTRRRLQALMAIGYTLPGIARRVGVAESSLHQAADGSWRRVRTSTAAKVARVYRQLATRPAPPTRTAEHARNQAMARGWHGPMAWDDIDDPACVPDWDGPTVPRHVHPDDVAELAARGLDDVAIGQRLGLSPRTVLRARTAHNIPAGGDGMTHYSGSVPDTKRKPDWRAQAICKTDPDTMFPDNNERGIDHAKKICAGCPVARPCLIDALRTGDNEFGIRGGLKPCERRATHKITGDRYTDPAVLAAAVLQVLHPATATRTLREVWEEHTYPIAGGHLGWRGALTFSYRGHSYAPKRTSFLLHRGHEPKGIVRRTCEVVECVHPLHLADNADRYRRKQAAGQVAA